MSDTPPDEVEVEGTITSDQQSALEAIIDDPLSKDELADELDTTDDNAKYFIKQLRRADVDIQYDKQSNSYWMPEVHDNPSGEEDIGEGEDLDQHELTIIAQLPAKRMELSDAIAAPPHVVDAYLGSIESKGVDIGYDEGRGDDSGVYYLPDQPKVRRLSTQAKGTKTRKANEFRTEQEAMILRRLESKPPLVATQDPIRGREDMVVGMGDIHMGDVVEDERGEEVYNPKVAAASVAHVTKKALELKKLQESVTFFDSCHLFWTGDMVTGESIYDGQAFDIKLQLADQLSMAVEVMLQQAISFAEEFDTLTITAVPGNHGEIRSSYNSGQANLDLLAYRWVTDRLIDRGYDNINFRTGEAKHFRNTPLRGGEWTMHIRHGHDEQIHVDATARSQADNRAFVVNHGMDGIIRGHHHTHREEDILNQYPVTTVPSPKPGDAFAEKIGRPDVSTTRKLGVTWRVSDKRFKTGKYVIDDHDLDADDLSIPSIDDVRSRGMVL